MSELWPWLALALLGAYHGINPAMGWLFAVALGLQERRRAAVVRALAPIALGHEAAVALAVLLFGAAAIAIELQVLRLLGAATLIGFGVYKLIRPRSHPKWVGFRVGARDLTVWSFLMSSAHGAGLMLVPVLLGLAPTEHDHSAHGHAAVAAGLSAASLARDAAAVVVHTTAMLVVMGFVAILVYDRLGVMILRRAWVNLDRVWAVTFVLAGGITLLT